MKILLIIYLFLTIMTMVINIIDLPKVEEKNIRITAFAIIIEVLLIIAGIYYIIN